MRTRRIARSGIVIPWVLLLFLPPGIRTVRAEDERAASRPARMEECDARVRKRPDELSSYHCYRILARHAQQWDQAIGRLESLLAIDPANQRARLYLGVVEMDRRSPRAESLLRTAAEAFTGDGDRTGEVHARLALVFLLGNSGRNDEAEAELRLASGAAAASADPLLQARVRIRKGWRAYNRADYGRALDLFREAETTLGSGTSAELQTETLSGLGATYWALGRLAESLDYYRREAELHTRLGDAYAEAGARFNILLLAANLQGADRIAPGEQRRLTREALDAAVRGGNRGAEAATRLALAQDTELDLADRIAEAEQALALNRDLHQFRETCFALRLLARYQLMEHPDRPARAYGLVREAIEMARSGADRFQIARGLLVRAGLRWETGPRERAVAESLETLDAIERIRDLQKDGMVRAWVFAPWAFAYYRYSGRLLCPPDVPPSPADLETAFRMVERLRARVLLDTLDAAKAHPLADPGDPTHDARAAVLERIAGLQRSLGEPSLSDADRRGSLEQLQHLEAEDSRLLAELADRDPAFRDLRKPDFPSLADLRGAVGDDQAILAYQLADWETDDDGERVARGSWVFVITRESVRVHPLPDAHVLQEAVTLFLGLLPRRDGSERQAAVRLYEEILDVALDGLPEEIDRLVVIPDGALHRLPFESLRADPRLPTIGVRYEMSLAPSATIWMRWKKNRPAPAPVPVLSLADPMHRPEDPGPSIERDSTGDLSRLPSLPGARTEARALARRLGGGSRVRSSDEASERFLKTADLTRFGLLHLAAHAVVDDREPERSAVVLAPGAPDEDGLLRMREVAALNLEGRVVILSACRSASGAVLEGEGVMSLARAFFQAGSHAVVGSLWRLKDEEAAALVEDFGRHLGEGLSLSAALAAARRERIDAGEPVAAWAGLVVIGDGDLVPLPGGRRRAPLLPFGVAVLAVVLAAASALLLIRRRRRS